MGGVSTALLLPLAYFRWSDADVAASVYPYKGVHAFRRAAAAQMKRMGMNDSDIMEIMGWEEVTMLRRYVASVSLELAQSAHRQFSPVDSAVAFNIR